MKKVFLTLFILSIVFCLISPSLFAQEIEKKSDEPAKSEIKITIKDSPEKNMHRDSDKYHDEAEIEDDDEDEDDDRDEDYDDDRDEEEILLHELLEEVRRLREEVRFLQDEIAYLRRIIEQSPMPERPLIRRSEGQPPRGWEPEPQPEDRWERDDRRREEPMRERDIDINAEIKRLEDEVRKNPKNIDARMMLADLYRQTGRKEVAIDQYKAVIRLAPDFDPPRKALEEIEKSRGEADHEENFNMGEVISANTDEVTLKTFEGNTVVFLVPKWQKEDGSWHFEKEIGEKAKSLDRGAKVRIFWNEKEGQRVIYRIERMKE